MERGRFSRTGSALSAGVDGWLPTPEMVLKRLKPCSDGPNATLTDADRDRPLPLAAEDAEILDQSPRYFRCSMKQSARFCEHAQRRSGDSPLGLAQDAPLSEFRLIVLQENYYKRAEAHA